jgi:hypothetical protein
MHSCGAHCCRRRSAEGLCHTMANRALLVVVLLVQWPFRMDLTCVTCVYQRQVPVEIRGELEGDHGPVSRSFSVGRLAESMIG